MKILLFQILTRKGHEVKIFTDSKIHNTDISMVTDKKSNLEKGMDGVDC